MRTYFVSFILSLSASLLLTFWARGLGIRYKIFNAPGGRRIHTKPIPRLGGPAIALAFFLPVYALLFWDNQLSWQWQAQSNQAVALLLGGLLIVGIGLWDDIWGLRARYKLFGQIFVACLAYYFGVQIHVISIPLLGDLEMGIFALPVTVFWILGFINAINLIDGVDGLCAGVVFIASVTVFFVAQVSGSPLAGLFAAALAGSMLGFLRFNFNPATIFLGDSGSYFIGYVLATTSIVGAQKSSTAVAVVAPLLAVGLPVMDTLWAILRRASHGRPIFAPDRGHIHHRLLDRGFGTKRVVITLYAISTLFAVGGILTLLGHNWETGLAFLVVLFIMFLVWRILNRAPAKNAAVVEEHLLPTIKAGVLLKQLPELLETLHHAPDETEIERQLAGFAERCELAQLELCVGERPPFKWQAPNPASEGGREDPLLISRCELQQDGQPLGSLVVGWHSEFGRVAPETETLLLLLGQVLAKALTKATRV